MVKQMKLRGTVRLNLDRTLDFNSKLYDNTEFTVRVDEHDIELQDEFQPDQMTVYGWLFVVQEAKQSDRCYLTLPKPTLQYGKQIVVQELQLMPRVMTLADFNPQTTGGKVKEAKVIDRKSVV